MLFFTVDRRPAREAANTCSFERVVMLDIPGPSVTELEEGSEGSGIVEPGRTSIVG